MTHPRGISRGIPRKPRSPLTGPDGKPATWGERLAALRYVPPLLRLVFETHRGYTAAILSLRVVRSFIPLSVLWVGKLIIDGVVGARALPAGVRPDWWHLGALLALEFAIAVGGEGLARLSALLESLL